MRWNDLGLFGFKEHDELGKILELTNGYYFELRPYQIDENEVIQMRIGKRLASGRRFEKWKFELDNLESCMLYINYVQQGDKFYELFGNLEGEIVK